MIEMNSKAASRVRIANLGMAVVTAIGLVREEYPDLTWEEVLAALHDASDRALGHLMNDEESTDA